MPSNPPRRPIEEESFLDAIATPSDLPVQEDARTLGGEARFAEEQARYLREENENLRSTRELRQQAAGRAFVYLCVMSSAVFGLLVAHGFGWWGFHLETAVLATLAGGTFVSVISVFGIVVKGLFPTTLSRDTDPPSRK